jgi:hypothetical protein
MGMYTAVKFSATLNVTGRAVVDFLEKVRFDKSVQKQTWQVAAEHFEFPWLVEWAKVDRCDFIPWGAYTPGGRDLDDVGHQHAIVEWESSTGDYVFRHVLPERSEDGRVWHVSSELKNYEREIQNFCENVLPHMLSEPCTVYYEYEVRRYDYDDPSPEFRTIDVLPFAGGEG